MFTVCVRGVRFVSSLGLVRDVTPSGVLPVRSLGAPRRVDYTGEFRSCRPSSGQQLVSVLENDLENIAERPELARRYVGEADPADSRLLGIFGISCALANGDAAADSAFVIRTMRREKRVPLAEARARPARSLDSASMCIWMQMDREKKKGAKCDLSIVTPRPRKASPHDCARASACAMLSLCLYVSGRPARHRHAHLQADPPSTPAPPVVEYETPGLEGG